MSAREPGKKTTRGEEQYRAAESPRGEETSSLTKVAWELELRTGQVLARKGALYVLVTNPVRRPQRARGRLGDVLVDRWSNEPMV